MVSGGRGKGREKDENTTQTEDSLAKPEHKGRRLGQRRTGLHAAVQYL